jgi:hypothetical protein
MKLQLVNIQENVAYTNTMHRHVENWKYKAKSDYLDSKLLCDSSISFNAAFCLSCSNSFTHIPYFNF